MSHNIRVATTYYKPANAQTDRIPDYYIHKTDKWLVFPHELNGLTEEEVFKNRPEIKKILKGVRKI